ncbi:MAG: flagellar hook-length control protein FliK [Comamonas sp.]
MSSPLPNTLLVQRLDAVLGVSLAKYASIARAGGPFDALLEPGQTAPVDPAKPRQERGSEPGLQRDTPTRQASGPEPADAGKASRATGSASAYPSSPTTLGPAARIVLGLLQSYPQTPQPPVLHQPLATTPLLQLPATPGAAASSTATATTPGGLGAASASSATAGPAQALLPTASASHPAIALLAQTLAARVQTSGMFYEAHLARVAFQGQPPQTLHEHPQAQSAHAAAPAAASAPAPVAPAAATSQAAPAPAATAPETAAPAPGNTPPALTSHSLSPDHALLVRQQLDVLATQQWAARAEAWPGVALDWHIERAPPDSQPDATDPDHRRNSPGNEGESERPWQTRLTLQLPSLGRVEAHLRIEGSRCHLRLYSEQSPERLRQHAAELQHQFAASSVSLGELQIAAALPRNGPEAPLAAPAPTASAPAPAP